MAITKLPKNALDSSGVTAAKVVDGVLVVPTIFQIVQLQVID